MKLVGQMSRTAKVRTMTTPLVRFPTIFLDPARFCRVRVFTANLAVDGWNRKSVEGPLSPDCVSRAARHTY